MKFYNDCFLLRTTLPVPGHSEVNLCSVISLGKDLSKITMPVIFNEPLSFLQRVAEYMEYAKLLKLAAQEETPIGRLQVNGSFYYVAQAVRRKIFFIKRKKYSLCRSTSLHSL